RSAGFARLMRERPFSVARDLRRQIAGETETSEAIFQGVTRSSRQPENLEDLTRREGAVRRAANRFAYLSDKTTLRATFAMKTIFEGRPPYGMHRRQEEPSYAPNRAR